MLIWIAGLASGNAGYGGWAWLKIAGAAPKGAAGGGKGFTAERAVLAGIAEALGGADEAEKAAALRIHTDSALAAAVGAGLAQVKAAGWAMADGAPVADRDLWEKIDKALSARTGAAAFVAGTVPGVEAVFVDAWAQLAHDKVKATGAFGAVIPRVNLAKVMEKRRR